MLSSENMYENRLQIFEKTLAQRKLTIRQYQDLKNKDVQNSILQPLSTAEVITELTRLANSNQIQLAEIKLDTPPDSKNSNQLLKISANGHYMNLVNFLKSILGISNLYIIENFKIVSTQPDLDSPSLMLTLQLKFYGIN